MDAMLKTLEKGIGKKNINNIMGLVAENPGIIDKISSVGKNVLSPSGSPGVSPPQYQTLLPQVPTTDFSFPGSTTTVASIDNGGVFAPGSSKYLRIGYIITAIILAWTIGNIIYTFRETDKNKKENVRSIHWLLFGASGTVPFLLTIWALLLIFVILLPFISSLAKSTEKIPSFLDRLGPVANLFSKIGNLVGA